MQKFLNSSLKNEPNFNMAGGRGTRPLRASRVCQMLPAVATLLPKMLPLKFLPFNSVTDVATFPTSYINDAPSLPHLPVRGSLAVGVPSLLKPNEAYSRLLKPK